MKNLVSNIATKRLRSLILALALLASLGAASCDSEGNPIPLLLMVDGHRGNMAGYLYVLNPANASYAVVAATRDAQGTHYGLSSIAFGPDGKLYGVTGAGGFGWEAENLRDPMLFEVNPVSGLLTAIGETVDSSMEPRYMSSIVFGPDGTLYGLVSVNDPTEAAGDLATIDPETGEVTVIGGDAGEWANGMVWDEEGERLLLAPQTSADGAMGEGLDGSLVSLNTTTGAPTTVVTLDGPLNSGGTEGVGVVAMAYVGDTLYALLTNWDGQQQVLATIDVATGDVEIIGKLPPRVKGLAGR
ncbi:MAG: hypothetical protein KDH09_19630 [Chrysiogenetes bacterium]|nr:hypothetical protein [Chrysiogenetes bacterium]